MRVDGGNAVGCCGETCLGFPFSQIGLDGSRKVLMTTCDSTWRVAETKKAPIVGAILGDCGWKRACGYDWYKALASISDSLVDTIQ